MTCPHLWQGVEDYSGLWERPWELRAIRPSASDEDLRIEAAKIVADLLSMAEPVRRSPATATCFSYEMRLL